MLNTLDLKKKVGAETLSKIMTALGEAIDLHASVNQTYGDKPYGYHLTAVFECALKHMEQYPAEDYQAILFGVAFHDSIEDARLTYNDVMKIAKKYMADDKALIATEIVYALTNEKGRNRDERANDKYYAGIRETPYASLVKLCDRYANMSNSIDEGHSMAAKYRKEMPHFLEQVVGVPEIKPVSFTVPPTLVDNLKNL